MEEKDSCCADTDRKAKRGSLRKAMIGEFEEANRVGIVGVYILLEARRWRK